MQYDVFISHSSSDKDTVARPLADALAQRSVNVWLDEQQLQVGDSIRRGIDYALMSSRFGVVILSPAYINSEWACKELDAFFSKETQNSKGILPILHNLTLEEARHFSPMLADKAALTTQDSIGVLADKIKASIQRFFQPTGDNVTSYPLPHRETNNMPVKKTIPVAIAGGVTLLFAILLVAAFYLRNCPEIISLFSAGSEWGKMAPPQCQSAPRMIQWMFTHQP